MATPKPGEIRCPTCHRSTPPAAFCTQCGSAIPPDARTRPRGMDRDELQERIRARRSGGEPYRRGGMPDDERGGYERFEPDPSDARARGRRADKRRQDRFEERGAAAAAGAAAVDADPPYSRPRVGPEPEARPDVTREPDDWSPRAAPAPTTGPIATEGQGRRGFTDEPADIEDDLEPVRVDHVSETMYDDDAAAYPYEYDAWDDDHEPRSSGAGAFAIVGFLALGVLALLGGAVLAGVFSGDPGVAEATATPAAIVSEAPIMSVAASAAATGAPSADPATSAPPAESGEPVVFPDGFTAEAQPCIPGSVRAEGCDSSGAVNNGQVEIWVGFTNGSSADVIGAEIVGPEGNTIGEGTIDLTRIGCGATCNGHTYFNFANLAAGTYEVNITRNGERADRITFEVS